jgi:8-oxo-dGTP pyrophosphatase MutT (NUDIX family)
MNRAGTLAAYDRLLQRLGGSEPEHGAAHVRIGATLTGPADARLLKMMPETTRRAAVLIGIQLQQEEPCFLLTVRAGHLRQHAGQIAFPGGAIDAGDASPAAAALREAREEVGLMPGQAEIIGYLPDQVVLTGFRVTPAVARITADFVPVPDRTEVEEVFMLPLSVLLDEANHALGRRNIGGLEFEVRDLAHGRHRIWGATAGMLFALYEMARP